jgi:hypothetical protein
LVKEKKETVSKELKDLMGFMAPPKEDIDEEIGTINRTK